MLVRNYNPEDMSEFIILFEKTHLFHATHRPDIFKTPHYTKEMLDQLLGDINLVAIEDNKLVGFLIANEKEILEDFVNRPRKFIFIEFLGVQKEYQKLGIGTMLMKEIETIATKKHISKVELSVWGFNENARTFYKSLGYNIKTMRLEKEIGE